MTRVGRQALKVPLEAALSEVQVPFLAGSLQDVKFDVILTQNTLPEREMEEEIRREAMSSWNVCILSQ